MLPVHGQLHLVAAAMNGEMVLIGEALGGEPRKGRRQHYMCENLDGINCFCLIIVRTKETNQG